MNKAIFERETSICRNLHDSEGGNCHWGECDKCEAIPFVYKIFKDEQAEDLDEARRIKREIFEN